MFRNYLRVAIRNLRKDKLISSINILGLTLGIAGCILAYVLVSHEFSYDSFHKQPEKMLRIYTDRDGFKMGSTVFNLLPSMKEDFEEVIDGVRVSFGKTICKWNNELVSKQYIRYTDSNYFEFFNFPVIYGDKTQMLDKKHSVVLNSKLAQKYYPDANPIGKVLNLYIEEQFIPFEITGVVEVPSNSSEEFELIAPMMSQYTNGPPDKLYSWGNYHLDTWIRISDNTTPELLEKKLPAFVGRHMKDYLESENIPLDKFIYFFKSMEEMRFSGWASGQGMLKQTSADQLYIFMGIGILVLVIACFNFINLTNAKASTRIGEIGLRKVVGARKKQLITQFLMESVLMSIIATAVGFCLADIFLPILNLLIDHELSISHSPELIFVVIGIAIFTGILAGIYPALIMSNLKPIDTLRNKQLAIGGNNKLTQLSIVLQFSLCISLFIASLIMYQQQQFMKNYDLGYEPEQVIVVPFEDASGDESRQLLAAFKQKFGLQPQIENVSGVNFAYTKGIQFYFASPPESDEQKIIISYGTDEEYLSTMNISLLAGRNFSKDLPTDKGNKLIVNPTFLKEFNIPENEAIGYILPENFNELTGQEIIGVVKDVHYMNLKYEISPMIIKMDEESYYGNMLVKSATNDYAEILALLEDYWKEIRPNYAFEYHFLDEEVEAQYKSQEQWNTITSFAGILALIISCIGLFGLTALTVVRRTKEIGIRKILGASKASIIKLVGRQFLFLVLFANVLAIPITLWMMNDWLQGFAYRIDMDILPFIVAAFIAMTIAILTISHHILRVARANPADALRNE